MLRNPNFFYFSGGGGGGSDPCPPSGSAILTKLFLAHSDTGYVLKIFALLCPALEYLENENAKINDEQEKESIICVSVGWKNPILGITVCHHLASLGMPNGDPLNRFYYMNKKRKNGQSTCHISILLSQLQGLHQICNLCRIVSRIRTGLKCTKFRGLS